MVAANVSSDGKVSGPRMSGERLSPGLYTLTINGQSFGNRKAAVPPVSFVTPVIGLKTRNGTVTHCSGNDKNYRVAPDGSAIIEVDCFAFDPKAGWQAADSAFDVQMIGPSR